jgi:hypothetical protein
MNRFFITSAVVGSILGVFHGRTYRTTNSQQPLPQEITCCVRDGVVGAAVYPFLLPISAYQLFTKAPSNTCIYKIMTSSSIKKSSPSSETSTLQ